MLMSRLPGHKFIGRMMVFRRFVLYYTVHGNEKDSSQAEGGVGLVISDSSEGGSKGSLVSSSEWTVKLQRMLALTPLMLFRYFLGYFFLFSLYLNSIYLLENSFF